MRCSYFMSGPLRDCYRKTRITLTLALSHRGRGDRRDCQGGNYGPVYFGGSKVNRGGSSLQVEALGKLSRSLPLQPYRVHRRLRDLLKNL